MQTYLKTKPVWVQMLVFLGIAFGLFIIAFTIGGFVLSKMTGIGIEQLQNSKNWDLANPNYRTYMRGMILLQFFFLFCIPALVFARISDPKPMRYLGLKAPSATIYWIWGILVLVVAFPFVEYIGIVNHKLAGGDEGWMKEMEEAALRQIKFMMQEKTPLELVKNLVFIALFAGVGEELFFRGILQRLFIRATRSPWAGIIITAVVFSGIHFQFYGFFPRFFLGILLGAIYWYSGSLWVAILAHFLYDAAVIVLVYFNPEMLQNTEATLIKGQELQLLIGAIVSLILTAAILWYMQKKSATSYEAIYNDDFPKQKDNFSF
jgi:membrane protease YdiL (CAAX protease family)